MCLLDCLVYVIVGWQVVNLDQKLRVQYKLLNKMLIRHITIPRHSHLVPLSEPKAIEQSQESADYSSYFTKTLNPEQPIFNMLSSEKEGQLTQSQKQFNDHSFSREIHQNYLIKQSPQRIDQIEADLHFTPKKQNYQNRSWQIQNPLQIDSIRQMKNRFPTFSTYKPQLNNNAYLNENTELIQNPQNPHTHQQNINNLHYRQSAQDQSEEVINNQHFNRLQKNREVYRTLQKFKLKNKGSELQDSRIKAHKKYTYDPPKQNFTYPEPEINQPLEKQPDRKQRKLQPLSAGKVKPFVSNPSLHQKQKKIMPQEQEENQNNGIHFYKQKQKSFSLRKSSEQEIVPAFKPKSQIHLSNKKLKEKSPTKRSIQEVEKRSIQQMDPMKIEVSYRTSLARVRQICSLNSIDKYIITMKIPEIFAYPLFSGNQAQEELFNKADEALKHLQIVKKDISIKKYSNCVVILSGSMGVVWHYNGKVYLGGWKHQILDEGAKHGLGLEWAPKKYVYYGQFAKNKREGVGIMKTSQNQVLAGLWRDNHFMRSLWLKADGSQVHHRHGHLLPNE